MSLLSQIDTSASVRQPAQLLHWVYLTLQDQAAPSQQTMMPAASHHSTTQYQDSSLLNPQAISEEVGSLHLLRRMVHLHVEVSGKACESALLTSVNKTRSQHSPVARI